jgi:hypothetical protein
MGSLLSSISGEFFVMHGADRKGEEYLGAWAGISDRTGIIVIAPEFSIKDFGEVHGYNLGNVESIGGLRNEKAVWSFSVIENIFDKLRSAGLTSTSYNMFGHSAGGQFVHRMLTFLPEARVELNISKPLPMRSSS